MRRLGSSLVALALTGVAACSGGSATTTPTTTTTATTATTTATTSTATTLAEIPDALPLVDEGWDWVELSPGSFAGNARYDGSYLVFEKQDVATVVAMRDDAVILEHTGPDDRQWIVQDIELGDHWLGIVENAGANEITASHVVVYDLETGGTVVDEMWDGATGPVGLPSISISGRYLATSGGLPDTGCLDVYDLGALASYGTPVRLGQVCVQKPILSIDLDGGDIALTTNEDQCSTAWTAGLYDRTERHGLTEHTNRTCWSNSPATSSPVTVWFESAPEGSRGIDLILGDNPTGETVSLGRGVRGSAEACWAGAVWIGGNDDVRFWDGGDTVQTVYSAGENPRVSCVGAWVTITTYRGIYASNMLTGSAVDACRVVEEADAAQLDVLQTALLDWVHTNYEEVPEDVEASVGGAIGGDGWWVGPAWFSDYLESAVFVWYPDGGVGVAWAGSADSEYDIRQYMLSILPDAPPAVLGCIDVSGFADM